MTMSKSESKFYYLQGSFAEIFTACGLESMVQIRKGVGPSEIERDLYARTPTFRIPGIQEQLEHYFLPDPVFYLMPQLPKDLAPYKGNYIYCDNGETKSLYYVNTEGTAEHVLIEDMVVFEQKLDSYNKHKQNPVLLNQEQIKQLVTDNGGFTHPVQASAETTPVSEYYLQGDMEGSGLKLILGSVPFFDENDPEDRVETAFVNAKDARGAYLDSHGKPAGFSFFYRADKPEQWIIIVTKNVHLPKEQHEVHILSSVDPRAFMLDKPVEVTDVDQSSLPNKIKEMQQIADSAAIGKIIGNILNSDGTIKKNPELLHDLFTGRMYPKKLFDDDEQWMALLENNTQKIMENPLVSTLHASLESPDELSKEEISDCLIEGSVLALALLNVQNSESLRNEPQVKKELYRLIHHLYKSGNIEMIPKIVNYPSNKDFFYFIDQLVVKTKSTDVLKEILDNLNVVREVHKSIQKSSNGRQLFTLLLDAGDPGPLIQRLHELTQPKANIKANILPLAMELILRNPAYPSEKLLEFLNQVPGIEQIKPELLHQFLAANFEQDHLAELFKPIQDAFAALDSLKITNPAAFTLALHSQEFRTIVAALQDGDPTKNQESGQYIELAINLDKLGLIANYSALSNDLNSVKAFNQFVKSEGLQAILHEKINQEGAEAIAQILKNPILNALLAANIKVTKSLGERILAPQGRLSAKLQEILESSEQDPLRKNALYQLAVDLDELGVLRSFEEFTADTTDFLKLIHKWCAVAGSEKLLKEQLAEAQLAPGLPALRVLGYNDYPGESFPNLLKNPQPNVIELLKWLEGRRVQNTYSREITTMALDFLFKQPDVEKLAFRDVLEFLKNTPKSSAHKGQMVEFLSDKYSDKASLTEATVVYKLLNAIGVGNEIYGLAIQDQHFKAIVQALPPMSADKDCGLITADECPDFEELKQKRNSNYILTAKELFYYNKHSNTLQKINLEALQLQKLKEQFPQTVTSLNSDQFKLLTDNAPIRQHNKVLVELAGKLKTHGFLNQYDRFAFDTQLASSFVKLIEYPILRELMLEKLKANDFGALTAILNNKIWHNFIEERIFISRAQIERLLDPVSEKSKAINILMPLALSEQKKVALQWAVIDTPTAENFRKVLFAINGNKKLVPEARAKMIETLCLLQLGDDTKGIKARDVFGMFLNNEKFRYSLFKIEDACMKITNRWKKDQSEDAKAKAQSFAAAEHPYRTGLYETVFDGQNQPTLKKDFEAKIEKVSRNMLDVVDVRRRSWIIAIVETLAEALNALTFTGLSRAIKGTTFFSRTTSGQEMRNLHESLTEPQQIMNDYKQELAASRDEDKDESAPEMKNV
ncbi:hypothetical protein OQJ15_13785 [Fluoribacter dumoffii]|uniref:hypothetical protein n=1 Tax=Fluoribacter dumoffii TaxID=463 RepID=UPI002243A942|nr:hypothetical protein [Fluoribacter dumoffii]MCW8387376.1 hypothetical protein [Fluoribacter dumoffii]MCW8497580.1 hypothetical protein [Fluoribacter dumoffii]